VSNSFCRGDDPGGSQNPEQAIIVAVYIADCEDSGRSVPVNDRRMDSLIARGSGRNKRRSEKERDRKAHGLLILSGQIGERGRFEQIFTKLKQKTEPNARSLTPRAPLD
jgi:hypothetical protein